MAPESVETSEPPSCRLRGLSVKEPAAANDFDEAFQFLANSRGQQHDAVCLKTTRRKVDWRIVPVMFLCYTMQFLDKVSLNVSSDCPADKSNGKGVVI